MRRIAGVVTDHVQIDVGAGNVVVLPELEVVGEPTPRRRVGINSSDFSED